jgi:hypothetical protein
MNIKTLRYVDLEDFGFSDETYDKITQYVYRYGFHNLQYINGLIEHFSNYDGEYITGDKDKAAHIKILNLMVEDGEVEVQVQVWS